MSLSRRTLCQACCVAIPLKSGEQLTPETLFAFSQVALAQTVKLLEEWGVRVEVIGIEAEVAQGVAVEAA